MVFFLAYFVGCSKCLKQFPRLQTESGKNKGNFSGFDRSTWTPRTSAEHKAAAALSCRAKTDSEKKRLENSGSRWSSLFELDYFDAIIGHTIDPMHCLFLGVAKHLTKMYVKRGVIDKGALIKLQTSIDEIRVPSAVGRIPSKIASGFCSFSADQWKNWTMIYSSTILKPVLPLDHYKYGLSSSGQLAYSVGRSYR